MDASNQARKQPAKRGARRRPECAPRASEPPRATRSRRPGEAPAANRIVHVQPVRREPADLDRFVAALLAMALAELDEERRTTRERE